MTKTKQTAKALEAKGRFGDSMLVHLNPIEVEGLAALVPGGKLTTNPETGLQEAFLPLVLGMMGGMAAPSLLGGTALATALGATGVAALGTGVGSGLGSLIETGDPGKALLSGALGGLGSWGIGSLMGGLGGEAANAVGASPALSGADFSAAAPSLSGRLAGPFGLDQGYNNLSGVSSSAAQAAAAAPPASDGLLSNKFIQGAIPALGGSFLGSMASGPGGSAPPPSPSRTPPPRLTGRREVYGQPAGYRPGFDPEARQVGPIQYQSRERFAGGGPVASMSMVPTNRGIGAFDMGDPVKVASTPGTPRASLNLRLRPQNPMAARRSQAGGGNVPTRDPVHGWSFSGGGGGAAGQDYSSLVADRHNRIMTAGQAARASSGASASAGAGAGGAGAGGAGGDVWPGNGLPLAYTAGINPSTGEITESGPNQGSFVPYTESPGPFPGTITRTSTDTGETTVLDAYPAEWGGGEAAGGLVRGGYAQGGAVAGPPQVGQADLEKIATEAEAALRGRHPNPQVAIQRYVQVFGAEALAQLRRRVLGAQRPQTFLPRQASGLTRGPGAGMDDAIPATINGQEPTSLSDGEFVVPADVVSHLGDGSTQAGASRLDGMMDRIRSAKTGSPQQPGQINQRAAMPA